MLVQKAHQPRRLPDGVVQLVPRFPLVFGAEGNVLIDGLLEELVLRVLEHQPHLEADAPNPLRLRPNVFSVQQDLPGGGL